MATSEITRGMTPAQRHWAMIEIDPATGCWNWTGSDQDSRGYSRFYVDGKRTLVHRWAYEHFIGKIPESETVHHRCVNPRCSFPDHLSALTQRENLMESDTALAAVNVRKRYCLNGHDLSVGYVNPTTGRRYCRICRNERMRQKRRERSTSGADTRPAGSGR